MIEVKHITKSFVTPKKYPGLKGAIKGLISTEKVVKTAVDDISFSIGEGEIVGYIGSNGAGKSTTIKMMTGILTPTKGECKVAGINPNKKRKENAKNIGVVFGQRTQLWWDLPLSESFTILKEIYNVANKEYDERMKFLDDVLGLNEFIHSPVRTLSLGQRMRADLAAALLHNPKVLYLDEPTIGLDLVVKDNIRKAIKEINQQYHTTIVLTTHDMGDMEELCNRIIIIDAGKMIYDGPLVDLKNKYGTKRKITMEIKDVNTIDTQVLVQSLKVAEDECMMEINQESSTLCITFDKNKLQVPQILTVVMNVAEVKDMQIEETELAEIVKEIYTHGVAEV